MHSLLSKGIRLVVSTVVIMVSFLSQSVMALDVGDQAPDFALPASDGKTYTLSQFQGKQPVVIAFFPKANTTG